MSRPDAVDRTVYVQSVRMWTLIQSVPGDPYAYRVSKIVPGTRNGAGDLMPEQPSATDEVIPDLVALDQIFMSIGLIKTDLLRSAFNGAWRLLNKFTNLDRLPLQESSSRIMHHVDDPRHRQEGAH